MKEKIGIALNYDKNLVEKPDYIDDWVYARSFDDFVNILQEYVNLYGKIPVLALTHDIDPTHFHFEAKRIPTLQIMYTKYKIPTGFHLVKWLIQYMKETSLDFWRIIIYGENEMGSSNMLYELEQYIKENKSKGVAFRMKWNTK